MEGLFIKNEIRVLASADRIWEVLMNPNETQRYMFGCRVQTDWKVGSNVDWIMPIEGKETAVVVGLVLENALPERLSFSVFDPFAGYENVPENHIDVVYSLEPVKDGFLLKVSQGDFSKVVNGQKRYEDSNAEGQGWMPILEVIKSIAEAG